MSGSVCCVACGCQNSLCHWLCRTNLTAIPLNRPHLICNHQTRHKTEQTNNKTCIRCNTSMSDGACQAAYLGLSRRGNVGFLGLELCRGGLHRFGSLGSRLTWLGQLISPSLRGQQGSRSRQSCLTTRHCIIHCTCHITAKGHSLCPRPVRKTGKPRFGKCKMLRTHHSGTQGSVSLM